MKKTASILLAAILLFTGSFVGANRLAAAAAPTFSVSDIEGNAGDTVKAYVQMSENPGITALRLNLTYDPEVLTLVSAGMADEGNLPNVTFGPTANNPFYLSWYDSMNNVTDASILAELTFRIREDAPAGTSIIEIRYLDYDVFNTDFENVHFDVVHGKVTVGCEHDFGGWTASGGNHTRSCSKCGETETGAHAWDSGRVTKPATDTADGERTYTCTVCGAIRTETIPKTGGGSVVIGDLNGDGLVDTDDALHLLMYTFFPEEYELNQNCDFDKNGIVDDNDALYLLMYVYFPDDYPLS